jgi:ribokinase
VSVLSPKPGSALVVLGAINWDTTVFEQRFGEPGEEVRVLKVQECPGGKGANTAVAAAKLLGAGRVALIGAVGDDDLGPRLTQGISDEGVDVGGVAVLGGTGSGRAFVVVDSQGRKVIHTMFGANDMLDASLLRAGRGSAPLAAARAVVIMDVPLPAALQAAREGKTTRAMVAYSPCIRSGLGLSRLRGVLSLADDLVLDREELSKLCGTDDLNEGSRVLRRAFPHLTVVVTLGRAGCVVGNEGRWTRVPAPDLSLLGLRAVNSTGSGDAFLAGYVCHSMAGHPPAEAARWGNLAGALKACSAETQGSPSREELEGAMRALPGVRQPRLGSPSRRASSHSRRRS